MLSGQVVCKRTAEYAHTVDFSIGFKSLRYQIVMVRAVLVFDVGIVAPDAISVFYWVPLVEAATFAYLVAEVPLAEVCLVVVAWQVVDDGIDLIGQRDVVLVCAVGVWPSAGHDGGTRRSADRRCDETNRRSSFR